MQKQFKLVNNDNSYNIVLSYNCDDNVCLIDSLLITVLGARLCGRSVISLRTLMNKTGKTVNININSNVITLIKEDVPRLIVDGI